MSEEQPTTEAHGFMASVARATAPLQALAATITVTSVITGVVPLTQVALSSGGPVMMVFGFAFTSLMALTLALSLADIASGLPNVKGGLIEWCRQLAPERYVRISSWVVGWLHFFAFATGATSCAFSFALFFSSALEIATGVVPQRWITVMVHIAVSIAFGAINAFKLNVNMISVVWHVVGPVTVLLAIIASSHHPPSVTWVFTHFENQTGWTNTFYVSLLGLVQGAFTMTGYDAPIHTSYNIENAAWKVPQGILTGFLVAFMMGELIILSILFGIQDIKAILNPTISGISAVEIFVHLLSRGGTTCILVIFMGTFFFCGQGILVACSEIGHELAVSGAFPKSEFLAKVGPDGQPARVGWLCAAISSGIGLLYLGNTTLLGAMSSAVAIELNLVYAIPIGLRLFFPHPARFQPGPFSLGYLQRPIAAIAVTWSIVGVFIFTLPGTYPITAENMNYASVLLFFTLAFILGYWFLSARHWFDLPSSSLTELKRSTTPGRKGSMQERELDEIENWLDNLERDLRDLK